MVNPSDNPLLIEENGSIATVTISPGTTNNTLNSATIQALTNVMLALEHEPEVCVLVLKGGEGYFCGGFDDDEFDRLSNIERRTRMLLFGDLIIAMRACTKAMIAEVRGDVVSAGLELIDACDLVVAADSAKFAAPGLANDFWEFSTQVALSRAMPRKQAMDLLLTRRALDAAEAKSFGLLNQHVSTAALSNTVAALASRIAENPPEWIERGKYRYRKQAAMMREDAYTYVSEEFHYDLEKIESAQQKP